VDDLSQLRCNSGPRLSRTDHGESNQLASRSVPILSIISNTGGLENNQEQARGTRTSAVVVFRRCVSWCPFAWSTPMTLGRLSSGVHRGALQGLGQHKLFASLHACHPTDHRTPISKSSDHGCGCLCFSLGNEIQILAPLPACLAACGRLQPSAMFGFMRFASAL
jgi:hypothetical protein